MLNKKEKNYIINFRLCFVVVFFLFFMYYNFIINFLVIINKIVNIDDIIGNIEWFILLYLKKICVELNLLNV